MSDFAPTATIVLAAAAEPLPICSGCRKAPVTSQDYRTCTPCREKRAEASRKSNERKRQEKRALLMGAIGLLKTGGALANIPVAESSSAGKSLKRKAEEEKIGDVMDRMRKRFKQMEFTRPAVASTTPSAPADPDGPVFDKFVNSAALYKDLKRRYPDNNTSLRFYGTYAIIAFPDVDNKARVRQVARDLKDSTTLHFNLDDRKSTRGSDPANTYTISYKCTCRATALLKRSGSDLSLYFGSKYAAKPAATSDEKPQADCRGRIEIVAEDDKSHPLGWLGQRVKVTVTHPKKA
ncbi:hypothetical protein DFH09DRAFT_1360227 [Mycena vulgaris]|nr:hypothetical protein DFH09DRAFT_1360227 [Mycena vulgaris]